MGRSRFSGHRGGVRTVTKKIDSVSWDVSNGFSAAQSQGTQAINFASVGTIPTTWMRIRGEISAWIDGLEAPAVSCRCTYGLILVPEGTGTTVLFDPVADGNAPWLLYGSAELAYEEHVVDVIGNPGMTSFRHTIDNKAMRIIRPDIEIQMVVVNTTTTSAASFNFGYQLRWLQGF